MLTIHKYVLNITDVQYIPMPRLAKILCVQMQNMCDTSDYIDRYKMVPCIWALVDTENEKIDRVIRIFGTGNPVDTTYMEYIGTVQDGNIFVWHVFADKGIYK